MNLFGFMKGGEKRARLSQADPRDPVVAKWFGSQNATETGVWMDESKALSVSAVYACVKVLSESIAILPLLLRRDFDKAGSEEARDYYLNDLLKRKPNDWQTPIEFKQMMATHIVLRGFSASRIVSDSKGRIQQLVPMHPDRVTPFKAPDGKRAFAYRPLNGGTEILLQDEVFYVPGNTDDGYKPMSVIAYAKETFALAYATSQYGARYYKNNANPGGLLQHPAKLSDVAYERLKQDWEMRHRGGENAHKIAILEEGMTWESINMSAKDAQFVDARRLSPIEICQIFRIPPHKIAILDRATFSNIENQSLEFVGDTLMPWLVKIEEAANRDLLQLPSERGYFYKFSVDEMLRGDQATRYAGYSTGLQNGFLSRNEVRQKEGLQPIEGGDVFMTPLNMGDQNAPPPPKFPDNKPTPAPNGKEGSNNG